MPELRKMGKVKGLMDYYFNAIPGDEAILEQMSNEGQIKKRFKRMQQVAEVTLNNMDTKRKIALEYNDIGRMLSFGRSKDEGKSSQQPHKKPVPIVDRRDRFNRSDSQRIDAMARSREESF